jgi:hypothetical protein
MEQSLGCMVVVQDSEIKAANVYSRLCARVRPGTVVLWEKLLHVRTNSSNKCLQFLQRSNAALRVLMVASIGMNSECTIPLALGGLIVAC